MHGSINFRRGDVQCSGPSDRSPMVTFKENYHLPRFQVPGGFFFLGWGGGWGWGWGGCLSPIETHITCDFPGGPDPISLYLEVDIFF